MSTQIECITNRICFFCQTNVDGELTRKQMETFGRTGLCPECFIESIRSNKSKSTKAPVQMGLPIVGTMPALIQMSPVSFGSLVLHDSKLLRDCIIRAVYQGPICTFDIICDSDTTRQKIGDFLRGQI